MVQLTVGYVAGFIAAGMFIARLWAPSIITFILSGLLGDTNSAATWTVAGQLFQKSYWPFILQGDSSYNAGVPQRILFLSRLMMFLGALISIAAVITPLGLYQVLDSGKTTQASFKYIKDSSPYGYATPLRGNASFSRICVDDVGGAGPGTLPIPRPCPFTDTVSIVTYGPSGVNWTYPYSYDLGIPQIITDIYSSGTSNNTTVSNYFDIQWRQYLSTNNTQYNNNSFYTIGSFQNMETLLLNNAYEPVEGLVVDTVKGGIGFRNHTFPPGFQNGVTWAEDLLFIEPETVCIDTNLTLDFEIMIIPGGNQDVVGVVLTDRGGFANLNHAVPSFDQSDPQKDPDLYGRAYKAAWLSNAYSALYYDITTPSNGTNDLGSLSAVESFIGKTYSIVGTSVIGTSRPSNGYSYLTISPEFGGYLQELFGGLNGTRAPSDSGTPTNPFNITSTSFDAINSECAPSNQSSPANITNLYIACGLIYGVPQRQDPGSPLIPDNGSKWSKPIYSCASAVKATIKTVSFTYNGTQDLLKNLVIPEVQDKNYSSESDIPIWGVENTGNSYENGAINLIWGLVSPTFENHPNVSTVQQSSLYLPGFSFLQDTTQELVYQDNLPGSEFYAGCMQTAWNVFGASLGTGIDYGGVNNMAVWARWQNLSKSAEKVSLIPNLIFTDNAASAVVGTKGVLGPMNAAPSNPVPILITPTVQKIKYRYPFAIPAWLAVFGLLVLSVAALVLGIRGRTVKRLSIHLRRASPGRILTAFMYPEKDGSTLNSVLLLTSKEWSQRLGAKVVNLSSDGDFEKPVMVDPMEKMDPPPKPVLNVTESEHDNSVYIDEGDFAAGNESDSNRDGAEQVEEHRIPRKTVSPATSVSGLGD